MGYELLENNNTKEAIEVFKHAVSEYPKSANAYSYLAAAYMTVGERDLAIRNYDKALELNPENENAKRMLEDLRKK